MDIEPIRLDVFKKTGISIDSDDPFFAAIVMLNSMATATEKKNEAILQLITEQVENLTKNEARTLEASKSLLKTTAGEIKSAVGQVIGVQEGISGAAAEQARTLIAPVMGDIAQVLRGLQAKDGLALEQLKKTQDTQARWAGNATLVIGGVVLTVLIATACSFYAGRTQAQKEIAQTAEWLDSDEGKYAIQLKNAGSLKALATCTAPITPNDWGKSADGKTCFARPTAGKIIGWKIGQ